MQRQHGQHRRQRVADHVVHQDAARAEALGAGGADEILAQRVEHRGAGHAEDHRGQPLADGDGRQGEQQQVLAGALREGHVAARRHDSQHLREDQHQQRADHEDRQGQQEGGDAGADAVEGPAPVQRRPGAGGYAEDDGEHGAGEDQLQRARQAQRDLLRHRIVIDQGGAQVAAQQPGEEAAVLRHQRQVEAQALAQLRHRRRIGGNAAGGKQQLRRIARHEVQGHEDDAGHHPDQGERDAGAAQDPEHQPKLTSSSVAPDSKVSAPGRLVKPWTFLSIA